MDYKRLRPSQVLLDSQNPRLPDGTASDKEAINRLLAEGATQLVSLARDLIERGESNPAELPIVIRSGDKYTVLEGNRRFAALKLLNDPRLSDDDDARRAFERLGSRLGGAPRSLYCAIAKDRVEADPWITLRHTGANEGVGVRTWNAEQTARHRRRMSAPIDAGTARSITIADDLEEVFQEDETLVDAIREVRRAKLTNIGRFFSGVTLTGLQFEIRADSDRKGKLYVRSSPEQLHGYFRWAFQFLTSNSVDAFKNDTLRTALLTANSRLLPKEFLAEHEWIVDLPFEFASSSDASDEGRVPSSPEIDPNSGEPAETGGTTADPVESAGASSPSSEEGADQEPAPSDESIAASADAEDKESTSVDEEGHATGADNDGELPEAAPRRRDRRPEAFLYSTVRLPNLSPPTQRLLREAKSLRIDDHYAIACVLARVILELAVSDEKVLNWTGAKETDTLQKKIRKCIFKIDPNIDNRDKVRQDLVQAFAEIEGVGVTYMHQFMHNPVAKADPHLARRFSAAFTPLLNSIDGAVA